MQEADFQGTFKEVDLETKESTEADTQNSAYLTCVGLGFFTGIHGSNILIAPLLFEHVLPRYTSIATFLSRIGIFWFSLILSLLIGNGFLNVGIFLACVYGPRCGLPRKKKTSGNALSPV